MMDRVAPRDTTSLDALVDRLWGPTGSSAVHVGPTLPATHVLAEDYVVVGRGQPRYLFPASATKVIRSAMTRHLSTTSTRARAVGAGLAGAWSTGPGRRLLTLGRLAVGVHRDVPREEWPEHLFFAHLGGVLGAGDVRAIIPIRRQTPNAKPTARLFAPDGEALGYAKLGWSAATSPLVAAEAATLQQVAGRLVGLQTPTVAAEGRWRDGSFLVAAPLPGGLRPWSGAPTEAAAELSAIASSDPSAGLEPVGDSAFVAGLRERHEAAAGSWPEQAEALSRWLDRLTSRHGHVELAIGRWHGDWVPWNVGRRDSVRYAWDWEYAACGVPVGLDVVHWHFQSALADPTATLLTAAPAAEAAVDELALLGVAPSSRRVVVELYLQEILTRALTLATQGAGWNPKLERHVAPFARGQGVR